MNILAQIGIFCIVFVLGGVAGDKIGVNRQKSADQYQFDQINIKLSDQKATAAKQLAVAHEANLKLILDRDTLKSTLEKRYADAQAVTTATRRELSALKLRFTVETGRAGGGSISSGGPEPLPANLAGTALVQLPEKIERDLFDWAEDADKLRDAYALCFGWVEGVKKLLPK